MRPSTFLFLLFLVVLAAALGWKFFAVIGAIIVGFVLLIALGIAYLVWSMKRRMRKAVRQFETAFQQAAEAQRQQAARTQAIDVDPLDKDKQSR